MENLTKKTSPSSPELADLQRWLRWIITEPRGIRKALETPARAGVHSTKARVEPQPRLLEMIVDAPPLPRDQRLGVYADAYFLRLLECLETDFPATRRALGKEAFAPLVADYLQNHPSSSPNVGDLGEAMPVFLRTHALVREFPYLAELALLEWEIIRSLHAPRLPALDPAQLAVPEDAWSKARLVLDPTVRLLATEWPVDQLWERRRLPEKKRGHRLSRKNPRRLLLYRDDAWVQVRVMDEPRWVTLQRLREGVRLGVLCEQLTAEFPGRAESLPVMEWFAHWIRAGVIKQIVFDGHAAA